jgi:hypothetical protein
MVLKHNLIKLNVQTCITGIKYLPEPFVGVSERRPTLTNQELDKFTEQIYSKVKNTPGLDKKFIKQCLIGISSVADKETEEKLIRLMNAFR